MDRTITATQANQGFSELLRDVQDGASFVVLSRGRAVARVIPVGDKDQPEKLDALLRFVEDQPQRMAGAWSREDLYSR